MTTEFQNEVYQFTRDQGFPVSTALLLRDAVFYSGRPDGPGALDEFRKVIGATKDEATWDLIANLIPVLKKMAPPYTSFHGDQLRYELDAWQRGTTRPVPLVAVFIIIICNPCCDFRGLGLADYMDSFEHWKPRGRGY